MSSVTPPEPCAACGGEHWVRTPRGWKRCVCFSDLITATYIKPMIRQGAMTLPADMLTREPWALEDRVVVGGDYTEFRQMVWRSLLEYSERRLTYDYFEAERLNEIRFQRDDEYVSLRQLKKLDLLILVVGIADVQNQFLPSLVQATIRLRQMLGKPTWVYTTQASRVVDRPTFSTSAAPPALPIVEPTEHDVKETTSSRMRKADAERRKRLL